MSAFHLLFIILTASRMPFFKIKFLKHDKMQSYLNSSLEALYDLLSIQGSQKPKVHAQGGFNGLRQDEQKSECLLEERC